MGAADFAELLRELKGRSGLSYGSLAKQLHVSTSTLHRYCNGDAVPAEFAPVERLARLCKASPEEMVEVHRRWILADAGRGRKASPPVSGAGAEAEPEAEPAEAGAQGSGVRKRRRAVVLAAAGVALVLGSTALALNGVPGSGGGSGGRSGEAADAGASGPPDVSPSGDDRGERSPTKSPSPSGDGKGDKDAPGGDSPAPGRGGSGGSPSGDGNARGDAPTGMPLTTRTRPYAYEDPCTQHFLVDRPPNAVPQPPFEQDAPGWVADLGAVASGGQFIEVTVQGTGSETVVLQGLHVRVQSTAAPLAWNDYRTGVGCGGNVSTKRFGVDLDDGEPVAQPVSGQRDFPYKVSESDPEVFYVKASAEAHDVRWYLEVEWSSGTRHGVMRVDDQGKPFRTSGNTGRTSYGWPPGSEKWSVTTDQ